MLENAALSVVSIPNLVLFSCVHYGTFKAESSSVSFLSLPFILQRMKVAGTVIKKKLKILCRLWMLGNK